MLNRLTIKNIALIEYAEIIFTEGLNVLSGETGSGKSVILESLNFVLGDKADKSLIRSGESECFVQAEFDVKDNSAIFSLFDEFDIEKEDVIIISRKFNIDGKSSIKLNGVSVTATMLRKFTSQLVDVHGQSEHFYLLNTTNQLKLLDGFCSDEILPIKASVKEYYDKLSDVKKTLDNMGGDEYQRLVKMDVLKFQINEINNADIKDGEEENLISLRDRLKNQELIAASLKAVKDSLGAEGGVIDLFSNSLRFLRQIYNSLRSTNARARVTSSVYSISEPTGIPRDKRVTLIPSGLISLARYIAVASPETSGFVATITSPTFPS